VVVDVLVVIIVVVIVVVGLSQYGPLVGNGLSHTDTSFEAQFKSFQDPLLRECIG